MSKDEKSHRSGRDNSGDERQRPNYNTKASVSRLQDLTVYLYQETQNQNLDVNVRRLAWTWFGQILEKLVEIKHGL